MKELKKLVHPLLILGGLNWGLLGLFDYNLIGSLLGAWPSLVMVIYVLMGLAAVWALMDKR